MWLLKENPKLPSIKDNGRFENEPDLVDINNVNNIHYWMWQIVNDKQSPFILDNAILPFMNRLAYFFDLGDDPRKGWIHQYVSVGGHVPILAVYLPAMQQEYILDLDNTFYVNGQVGYSKAILTTLRCICTVDRLSYLQIDPNYDGITMDYFPLGKNSQRRVPNPIRTQFTLSNNMHIDKNDYHKRIVRTYRNNIHNICNIMNNYYMIIRNRDNRF